MCDDIIISSRTCSFNIFRFLEVSHSTVAQACTGSVLDSFPTRLNEICNILISSLWQSAALSFTTQHAMSPEFGEK